MQCRNNVSYAGAGVRLCAYIVDQIILLMVIAMMAGILGVLGLFGLDTVLKYEILFHFTVTAIIYYMVKKIYFIAFTYTSGQTVGKKLFRIKVVNDDLTKVNFWRVFYREVIGRYLCGLKQFVWIGYLIIVLDEEKKGAHDILSDTRVVYDSHINNEEITEKAQLKEMLDKNRTDIVGIIQEEIPEDNGKEIETDIENTQASAVNEEDMESIDYYSENEE